jgi:tetratricopeptide (TPR) repeat protein
MDHMWEVLAAAAVSKITERVIDMYFGARRPAPQPAEVAALPPPRQPVGSMSSSLSLVSLDTACDHWYAGRFVEAIDMLSTMVARPPQDIEALSYRGQILADIGFATLALQDLSKSLTLSRDATLDAYSKSARAFAYGTLNQMGAAERDFADSLAVAPRNAWTYYRRGILRYQRGEYAAAAQDLIDALSLREPALIDLHRQHAAETLTECGD